jgi:hypothetical protein
MSPQPPAPASPANGVGAVRRGSARRFAAASVLALGLAAGTAAQDAARVDFQREILPILEQNCVECHRASWTDERGNRQVAKGGLRLDGKAHVLAGGDNGPVLQPGRSAQSPLYTRTVLPADHDEKMPHERDPLTKAQTEILKRWIDEGADFGGWVGATDGPAPAAGASAAASSRIPAMLAENLDPLPAAALAKVAGGKARVTPIATGSPLLRVEFPGREDEVGDADVAALAPLREHVAVLVLARTRITDQALADVARMPRLVQLDLRETKVTERGVAALGALPELAHLNLFGTEVGDGVAAALARLAKLAAVHVWESRVTEAGLASLREALPKARVAGAPALPGPEPPGAAGGGRRRR